MTRLALNIADLIRRHNHMITPILLGPVTAGRIMVNAEPEILDGGAVILECEETRARSIAQVLRDHDDRKKEYRTRVYREGPRGGWVKVTAKETIITAEEIKACPKTG